jgi:hypothetical protein
MWCKEFSLFSVQDGFLMLLQQLWISMAQGSEFATIHGLQILVRLLTSKSGHTECKAQWKQGLQLLVKAPKIAMMFCMKLVMRKRLVF